MRIVVYGLSITSSWGNGHATTYRALLKALASRGHSIHFVEQDVEWYRNHRDLAMPDFCSVQLYTCWAENKDAVVRAATGADAIVIGSYFADTNLLTVRLLEGPCAPILFYDIDTPITIAALRQMGATPYLPASLIPHFAAYLSFSAGPVLLELERTFKARRALAFMCSVDPDTYKPGSTTSQFHSDLSYLGTFAEDRQPKLMAFLNDAAERLPQQNFLVAGPQYPEDISWQANVRHLQHVPPAEHPAFYSSSRFTLNLTRADMVAAGYSPSVRLFEASACGACILSDSWPGLSDFLTPGEEILLPADCAEVTDLLVNVSETVRLQIGARARDRILSEHTAAHRAAQFEHIVSECANY